MKRAIKVIDLVEPLEWHEKSVRKIGIRSPNGVDAMQEPRTVVFKGGEPLLVTNDIFVRELVERLTVQADGELFDGGPPPLSMFSLADGIAMRDAVLDFFTEAAQQASLKRSTSSSSTTTSSLGTSQPA